MAKKKISELPAGGALNGTELVPIVQTGTTKRITAQDIANLGNASGVEGSGTINYLAKFTATSTIGNSLIFDNGTSVGIGTTTPDAQLVLNGSSFSRFNMRAGNVRYGTIYADSGVLAIASITAIPLVLGTNDIARLTIASTGAATFTENVTAKRYLTNYSYFGGGANYNIKLNNDLSADSGFIYQLGGSTAIASNSYYNSAGVYTATATSASSIELAGGATIFYNNSGLTSGGTFSQTERMRITSAGLVGIGTTSPQAKLHSNADILTGYFQNGTDGIYDALKLTNNTGNNTLSGNGARIQFYNNSNNSTNLIGSSIRSVNTDYGWASDLILSSVKNNGYATQSVVDAIWIKNSGNVGIGTTNPLNKFVISNGGAQGLEIGADATYNVNLAAYNRSSPGYIPFQLDASKISFLTGNVLIGTTTDVASSKLTIDSTTQGVLVPRMTETQINNINLPATGLLVYNTNQNHMCMFDGSVWKKLSMSNM